VSRRVDRALVEELLADESLSYREIARRAGCSEWSVRRIDRDLADAADAEPCNSGPLFAPDEPGYVGWVVVGLVAIVVVVACWSFNSEGEF
jgi:hypothetical protein